MKLKVKITQTTSMTKTVELTNEETAVLINGTQKEKDKVLKNIVLERGIDLAWSKKELQPPTVKYTMIR